MALDIQPVFVGGPLHGEPVVQAVINVGQDYVAVENAWSDPFNPSTELTQVRYTPRRVIIGRQGQDSHGYTVRNVMPLKVWVDTRLCDRGRTLLMNAIITENRWGEVLSFGMVSGS